MAVRNHKNIVNLFLASHSTLEFTVNCNKVELWKKITAVMTDSVEKTCRLKG